MVDERSPLAQPAPPSRGPRSPASWIGGVDLMACCALMGLAVLAYMVLPAGSLLRMTSAVSVLFFVPGYLLIEASAGPATTAASRAVRAVAAVGVSPALVGLLALAAALLPGGFRPAPILTLLAVASAALTAAALWRRRTHVQQGLAEPEPMGA